MKLWFHNEFVSKSSYALWIRQNYATTGMCLFQLDSWLPIVWITPLIWGLLIRKVVVLWKAGMIRKWFRASPYRWSSPFTTKRTNLSYLYSTRKLQKLPVVLTLLIMFVNKLLYFLEVTMAWNRVFPSSCIVELYQVRCVVKKLIIYGYQRKDNFKHV